MGLANKLGLVGVEPGAEQFQGGLAFGAFAADEGQLRFETGVLHFETGVFAQPLGILPLNRNPSSDWILSQGGKFGIKSSEFLLALPEFGFQLGSFGQQQRLLVVA